MSRENSTTGSSGFSDVAANTYYSAAVAWGVRAGVTNGTSATTFSPDAPITREEICAMLYRYANYQGHNFSYTQAAQAFTDQNDISTYALSAVDTMHRSGIIDGYINGSFLPQRYANRAEAAKMLALLQQMITSTTAVTASYAA